MPRTLKPGELVLKLLTIFGQPTGCLDSGVHGTMSEFPTLQNLYAGDVCKYC